MMRNQVQHAANPEIDRLIQQIVKEDANYALTEMRSVHRENLVVPVTLVFSDGSTQHTHSRNISSIGICLIGTESIPINELVDLEIYRLKGSPSRIVADPRWCKPFGSTYFMSGWKFVQLKRSH
jgi:hypothetical protein